MTGPIDMRCFLNSPRAIRLCQSWLDCGVEAFSRHDSPTFWVGKSLAHVLKTKKCGRKHASSAMLERIDLPSLVLGSKGLLCTGRPSSRWHGLTLFKRSILPPISYLLFAFKDLFPTVSSDPSSTWSDHILLHVFRFHGEVKQAEAEWIGNPILWILFLWWQKLG